MASCESCVHRAACGEGAIVCGRRRRRWRAAAAKIRRQARCPAKHAAIGALLRAARSLAAAARGMSAHAQVINGARVMKKKYFIGSAHRGANVPRRAQYRYRGVLLAAWRAFYAHLPRGGLAKQYHRRWPPVRLAAACLYDGCQAAIMTAENETRRKRSMFSGERGIVNGMRQQPWLNKRRGGEMLAKRVALAHHSLLISGAHVCRIGACQNTWAVTSRRVEGVGEGAEIALMLRRDGDDAQRRWRRLGAISLLTALPDWPAGAHLLLKTPYLAAITIYFEVITRHAIYHCYG